MPEIIRDRTWCLFRDDSGVEWEVMDLWAGYTHERYPSNERANERIFRRFTPAYGSQRPILVEERRYAFREGETRWFLPDEWQRQLSAARRPSPSTAGASPRTPAP